MTCQQVVSSDCTRGLASHHGASSGAVIESRAAAVLSKAAEGYVKWCGWHGMQGVRVQIAVAAPQGRAIIRPFGEISERNRDLLGQD